MIEEIDSQDVYKSYNNSQKLIQWGLNTMIRKSFNAKSKFEEEQLHAYLLDFFNDKVVQSCLRGEGGLPIIGGNVKKVDFMEMKVTATTLDMFDKLADHDILRIGSSISKCLEERYDDVTVDDKLREMLVNEDSENSFIFTEEEKQEFIFNIFKHFAIGGGICQPEDNIDPYFELTKLTYKELISVYRHPKTDKIAISSRVFKIKKIEGDSKLFPNSSPHSFCYVIVDPRKGDIKLWYNAFVPFW